MFIKIYENVSFLKLQQQQSCLIWTKTVGLFG